MLHYGSPRSLSLTLCMLFKKFLGYNLAKFLKELCEELFVKFYIMFLKSIQKEDNETTAM